MNPPKAWFSLWDYPNAFKGSEPFFWEKKVFKGYTDFENNFQIIQKECLDLLQNKKAQPYFKKSMVTGGKGYNTISLKWWDINFYKNRKSCPKLSQLLDKYPEISTLSINVLEASSSILPHMGDTNSVFRAHFGLVIPKPLPECGIRVGNEKKSWVEGDWVIFTDAYEHETWNESQQDRILLLIDIFRPEFISKRKRISATVLCSLFLQKRMQKWLWLERNIKGIVNFLAPSLILLIILRVKYLNFIKKY